MSDVEPFMIVSALIFWEVLNRNNCVCFSIDQGRFLSYDLRKLNTLLFALSAGTVREWEKALTGGTHVARGGTSLLPL